MVATNDDIVKELKDIKRLIKAQITDQNYANEALNKTD